MYNDRSMFLCSAGHDHCRGKDAQKFIGNKTSLTHIMGSNEKSQTVWLTCIRELPQSATSILPCLSTATPVGAPNWPLPSPAEPNVNFNEPDSISNTCMMKQYTDNSNTLQKYIKLTTLSTRFTVRYKNLDKPAINVKFSGCYQCHHRVTDHDIISRFHIYPRCFIAMMWGKNCDKCLIFWYRFFHKLMITPVHCCAFNFNRKNRKLSQSPSGRWW